MTICVVYWEDYFTLETKYRIVGTPNAEEIGKRLVEFARESQGSVDLPISVLVGFAVRTRTFWHRMEDEGLVPQGTVMEMEGRDPLSLQRIVI